MADANDKGKRDPKWSPMNRRELLKLSPVLLLGAFAIDKFQLPLVEEGVRFSDWAAGKLFLGHHLAPTFADSQVVPLEKFPYNGYDVIDPGVDLENWTLTVAGAVDKPGEYTLAQIQSLPKINQNTRHVCVEGGDAIGSVGGACVSEFMSAVGVDNAVCYVT